MKRTIKAPSASRWLARIVSLGVFTYVWHSFTSTYDLAELTGTMDFRFGCFVGFFSLWAIAELLGLFDAFITRRVKARRPAKPTPLPIDPANPPEKVLGVHVEGEEPVRCDCHSKPIEDNAEIWLWPQPTKIICAQKGKAE